MLKKQLFTAMAAVLLLLTACGGRGQEYSGDAVYYQFTDSEGNSVALSEKPEKTAVLFSSFADIWVTAGGRVDITVGETLERGFADEGTALVDKGAGKEIDVEALLAAEPDFVICSADIKAQSDAAVLIRSAGIPCAAFRVESFDDYLDVLKICTDITENPEAYAAYGTDMEEKIDALLEKIPKTGAEGKVLFIRSGSGESSAKAKNAAQHFAAAMLKELHADNIAENVPVLLDGLSIEEILKEDPQKIFISTMGDEEAAKAYMDSVLSSEAWQQVSAVKEDACYYLPKELFQFKPNARWYEAYLYLAELLYPETDFQE